jgi:uncharacterized protein (DUF58 family)
VRQQEQPWQGRTTVLLDVRRSTHDTVSFEAAVSAAASIITANGARRDLVRLAATDGADSGFAAGSAHLQALLEHLAVVEPSGGASLRAMLDLLHRDGQGALIVVVAETTGDELASTARLRQRFGMITVVQVEKGRVATSGRYEQQPAIAAARASLIRVTRDTPFATAWDRAMAAAASQRSSVRTGSPG